MIPPDREAKGLEKEVERFRDIIRRAKSYIFVEDSGAFSHLSQASLHGSPEFSWGTVKHIHKILSEADDDADEGRARKARDTS